MTPATRGLGAVAAVLAATGVAAAAVGSHALSAVADVDAQAGAVWASAVQLHLFHAAAFLGVAALASHRASPWVTRGALVVLAGLVLFCGSLYWRVLGGADSSGPTAPAGGMLIMAGWLVVALALAFSRTRD